MVAAENPVHVDPAIFVLAVDDDAIILEVLQAGLEEGGYAVAIAGNGQGAVAMLDRDPAKYRALVTDVDMGKGALSGWDVARHARELNPDMPVVYVTGGDGDDWSANGVPNSILVMKPFAPAQVVTAVSQLLNTGSNNPR